MLKHIFWSNLSKRLFVDNSVSKRTFDMNKCSKFQKPPVLSKEVFEYISTKREAHKMSQVCFFKLYNFQKLPLLSREIFEYVSIKRETYKMSKVSIRASLNLSKKDVFEYAFTTREAHKTSKVCFFGRDFLIDDGRGKILNHIDMSMMVWGGIFI